MSDYKPIVKYNSYTNTIVLPPKISAGLLGDFAAAIALWRKRNKTNSLILDFSHVYRAFANGMLGIIATADELRRQGFTILINLPEAITARRFFAATSWTYLLNPEAANEYKLNTKHYVQRFKSFEEIPHVINHFMEIIMGHIEMPADVLAALEWSITEICDNVINHAEAPTGGLLQVIAYPQNNLVAFTVADAGRGILHSLKEGIPNLKTDLDAIREAIKAGVTRNKSKGQGNGLAGTSRITTMTGGSLDVITGTGRLLLQQDKETPMEGSAIQQFEGTCVSGQILMNHEFSVVEALSFSDIKYEPYTIVDSKYEKDDEDALYMRISDQVEGAGTRSAGKELHYKVMNLLVAKPGYPVYLDWNNINIIASSFADEFVGKLFVQLGKEKFEKVIRNINMTEVVEHIISKAITERSATG